MNPVDPEDRAAVAAYLANPSRRNKVDRDGLHLSPHGLLGAHSQEEMAAHRALLRGAGPAPGSQGRDGDAGLANLRHVPGATGSSTCIAHQGGPNESDSRHSRPAPRPHARALPKSGTQ
jgi:hypothetical protein